ncbi:MAG: hypothetical protein JWN95_3718 [Frankiales bacterium]|nr:hypothetical protein [Frankiales bacterium]
MLVLDFDGVICDALVECAAVTWFAADPDAMSAAVGLANLIPRIPVEFLDIFRQVRCYARTLDQFVVALHPAAFSVVDQAGFDALLAATPSFEREHFGAAATALREFWRTTEPDVWLDLHTLYPGIADLLARHRGRLVVVTAKDEASVRGVLDRHELLDCVTEVLGECRDKGGAVLELAARLGMAIEQVTFVDDNVPNVRGVAATGAATWWARWGYHTAEHAELASRFGVNPLDLHCLDVIAA